MNHQGPTSDNDKTRHNLNPSPPGADSQITAQSADLLAATQHSQKGEDRGDDRECDRRGCATSKSKQIETKDLEADERGVVESTAAGEGQATGLASQYSAPRLARNRRAAAIRKSLRDKKKTQTNLTATGVSASAMAEEAGSATSQTVRKNDVGPRTTRYQLRLGKDSCQVGAEAGSRMDHQEDKDNGPHSTIQMDEKMKEKETSKAADVGNGEKRSSSSSEDEFAFHGTQSRTLTPPRLHGNHVLSGNLNLEVLDATPPTKSNSNKHIINDSEMKMEKKKRSAAETPWRNFDKTKSYSGKLQPKHKQSKLYAGSSPLRRMAAKNHSDYDANADVGTHIHEIEAKRQTKQEKGVERPQQLQQHIVESKPHETKMDEIDEKIRPSSLIDTTIEIVMKPPIDSACKPNNHGGGHGKEWKVEKVEEEIENGNDYGGEELLEFSPLTCPTQPFGDYIDEDVFDGDENDDNGVEDGNDDKKETGEDKTENEVGEKIMIEKVVEMDVAEGKFVRIEAENEKDADIIDMKNEDGNSKKDENNGNQNDAITNDRNRDGEREAGPISDDAQMSADFSVVNSKSNDRTGPVDEAENNAGNVGSSDMDDKGRLTTRILKNNTVGTNCNASGTMVGSAVVTRSHGRERMGQPKPTPASGITDLELKKRGRRFKKGATYKALAVLEENDEEDDGCKGKVINDDATVNDDHDYGHSFTDKGLDLQSSDRGKMLTKPEQEKAMLTESMMSPSLLPPPSNLNESSSSSDGADAAYSALAGATTSAAATAINRNPRQEFIIKVHSELENLGKALACPLCLHTLKEATILPCMHAYCGPCINSAFCPPPTDFKGRGRGRSKKKNSPPRHASDSCPICKFKCGRRSMVRSEHLDELVRGFKLTLRAFGLTPIEHGAGVQMTQLDPEEVDYGDEDDTEANDDVKIPAMNIPQSTAASISKTPAVHRGFDNHQPLPQRKKKADLVEYQQHLQVSKVVRDAFASAQLESIAGTNLPPDQNTIRRTSDRHQTPKLSLRITKEEIERQAKLQKYRILAQEQDAVVRADEEALNKVVRRRRGKKSDTTKTYLDGECDGPADEKNVHETTDNNYVQPEGEKAKHQTNPTTKEFNNHAIAESNVQKAAKSTPRKETETIFEEFCTAPEGSIYCTAREDSQTCAFTVNTAPSPVVVHDGNTAKAARPKRKFSAEFTGDERKSDYNQPKDVVETGRIRNQSITSAEFSPVKVHDGNTVRKSRHGSGSNLMLVDSQPKYPRPVLPGKELPRSETLKISNSEEAKTVQSNSETFPANKVALQQIDAAEDDNPVANTAHVEGDHDYPTIDETAKDTDVIRTKVSAVDIPPLENENIKGNDGANEVFTESQAQPIDREEIKKGSIVMVQSRFWPGINKPGGVARVVTVHQAPGNSLKYDVAYVLGGREKKVDESFVSLHNMTASTHESGGLEANGNGHCIETSSSLESRQARMRSASTTRRKEPTSAPAAISNLSKEALKEIPADVLEWAGIVSVQSKKKARTRSKSPEKSPKKANSPSTTTKKKASRHNKRALQESTNVIAAKKSKKLTFVPKTSFLSQAAFTQTDQENIPPRNTNESPPEVIRQVALTLSTKEIMDLASKRYSSLLCFPPATDTPTPTTIYTVTSSLSDGDTDALVSLCKILKANKVNIKIMKEFQPNTTMLCITSTAGGSPSTACQTSSLIDVIVSKTRTSKVMRSALAGIPIVTPAWIDECLKESRVVAPAEKLFVNTLPMRRATKVCDNDESQEDGIQLASFGVAKYAAQIQRAQSEGIRAKGLLDGIGVMMCGTWKMIPSPMKKDLKILLHEAGATKITSVSTMSRALSNIANGGSEFERVVFLCDDSVSDKSCGISESLLNEAKFAINSGKIRQDVVMAVNFNWLFDCISCAALMPSKMYEPVAPRAKELWNLTYNEDV